MLPVHHKIFKFPKLRVPLLQYKAGTIWPNSCHLVRTGAQENDTNAGILTLNVCNKQTFTLLLEFCDICQYP